MADQNQDLHGNAPDTSPFALLLIDVINDLEFEGGEKLYPQALAMAQKLAQLKAHAKQQRIPVIYVNDNFGKWRSDFNCLLQHCLAEGVRGAAMVELLRPSADDYFVLKPKHSGFYSTTLDTLLQYLQAHTLILTGLVTDICVFFTANDAYMRDFKLFVPADCVAAIDEKQNKYALQMMERVLKADIREADLLELF